MSTSGAGRGGLGAGLQQAFHQVITRRATDVFVGGDGAHDLVDLVPVHVHLLGKRLVHRHERGGDSGARGGVLAQQAELADCFLALDVAGKRLRVSLKQAGGGLSGLELVLEWVGFRACAHAPAAAVGAIFGHGFSPPLRCAGVNREFDSDFFCAAPQAR